MNLPKKEISISQIRSFYECPRCWYYHYYLKVEMPEKSHFTFGKRVHDALAHYHTGKGKIDEDLKPYVEIYSKTYTPEYQTVEKMFTIPLIHPVTGVRAEGIMLKGKADLVKDSWVIDHKTASRLANWSQRKVDEDIQGTVYSYWHVHKFKKEPSGIRFNILVKGEKPQLFYFDTFRTTGDYVVMFDYFMMYVNLVKGLKEIPAHAGRCKLKELFP